MEPISIILGLASVVPTIAKWIGGEDSTVGKVADAAIGLAKNITGESDPATAIEKLKINQEYSLRFEQLWAEAERGIQDNLTRRHEADMRSDSWLSKNVRPLCLIGLTMAVMGAVFANSVPNDKLSALTELASWVFGYYFVGRSVFDKGAVKASLGGVK